ncbi:deoxycytidylate deaminase [Alkaliphilus oremlandii]|uniref:CMP/dCMP deaminase zinc-binding n=1 Tax=Alkaliphilus oremlandii (strain OhILAs) TaxID=350688 RepID=A8MJX0_ALKOO|nr:dCMP deaminase family protein [Alkaliphilus oremlandii]ABW20102.1 CMP/dCMP deaminase zinc-binding [Alkaliphilus oremlandii OhILAs]
MRPSWDEYFMEMAEIVKTRSTCLRRQVGAVVVKDRRVLASGYNGAPTGLKHCEETGCLRDRLGIPSGQRHELCRGLHAEQNAIIQASLHGVKLEDATIYVTHQPCIICAKMVINAGINKVVFKGDYPDELSLQMLEEAGIQLVKV